MHIRCPHCRNPIEVIDDDQLRDIICPSCGSSFNLLPDETVSHRSVAHRMLGRFELIERIGIGAFGEVWTAHDSELDRTVAVKIPRKDQLTVEEAEAFLREARSAAQLHHPSIVAVHGGEQRCVARFCWQIRQCGLWEHERQHETNRESDSLLWRGPASGSGTWPMRRTGWTPWQRPPDEGNCETPRAPDHASAGGTPAAEIVIPGTASPLLHTTELVHRLST